jgi:hypothetical protein
MLQQVLRELREANGPLSLDELSRRLDIERGALDGMVQTLVRLGRLRDDRAMASVCGMHCGGCAVADECADASHLPRTYSVVGAGRNEAACS